MNEFFPLVFPAMVILLVLSSLAEMAVSGMWLPFYYRLGIPLYRKEVSLTSMPDLAAKIPELEQKLTRSMWRPAIVFRALNKHEIAFRNSFGSRNAMAGLIRLDPRGGKMQISGHLYWTFLVLPIVFLLFVFTTFLPTTFFVFLLAIFALNFGLQRYHYSQIAKVIEETAVSSSAVSNTFETPTLENETDLLWQESKPFETTSYEPEYDPFTTKKPQSYFNQTELILLGVLAALVVGAAIVGLFLFG